MDEELHFLDASFGALAGNILSNREALGKAGAPYDLFLRTDISNLTTDGFKVIWLLGIPRLSSAESKWINTMLASGITVLWTNLEGTFIFQDQASSALPENQFEWTAPELRSLWRKAGVHIYADSDDVIYAGNGWLSLHTANGGRKQISLPSLSNIINPLNGKTVAESTTSFEVEMAAGETRIFRIEEPG